MKMTKRLLALTLAFLLAFGSVPTAVFAAEEEPIADVSTVEVVSEPAPAQEPAPQETAPEADSASAEPAPEESAPVEPAPEEAAPETAPEEPAPEAGENQEAAPEQPAPETAPEANENSDEYSSAPEAQIVTVTYILVKDGERRPEVTKDFTAGEILDAPEELKAEVDALAAAGCTVTWHFDAEDGQEFHLEDAPVVTEAKTVYIVAAAPAADAPAADAPVADAPAIDTGLGGFQLMGQYVGPYKEAEDENTPQVFFYVEFVTEDGKLLHEPVSFAEELKDGRYNISAENGTVTDIPAGYNKAVVDVEGFAFDPVTGVLTGSGTAEEGDTVALVVTFSGDTAQYTIKTYLQNLEGDDYTEAPEMDTYGVGVIGTNTDVEEAPEVEGFVLNRVADTTVSADGAAVVSIYYDRETYTVTFNTDGGSFVSSQAVRYGGTIQTPEPPTKVGYSFAGWENLTGDPVTSDVEVKAIWTAESVDYTLVYMAENADDESFSYVGSVKLQGLSGSAITVDKAVADRNAPTIDDVFDTTHFTFKEAEPGKTVAPDGSTVVLVKYSRNWYLLTFSGVTGNRTCSKREHQHSDSCYTCTLKEHTHSDEDGCYRWTCGMEEHTHSYPYGQSADKNRDKTIGCYTSEKTTDRWGRETWSWVLTCDKKEHTHSTRRCTYDVICTEQEHSHWRNPDQCQKEFTCTQEEHTHTRDCYPADAKLVYAKWQADIREQWKAAVGYEKSWEWNNANTSFQSTMPGESKYVEKGDTYGETPHQLVYYVEADRDTADAVYNDQYGRYFTVFADFTIKTTSGAFPTFKEEFMPIDGYDRLDSNITGFAGGYNHTADSEYNHANFVSGGPNNFYYTRHPYDLKLINTDGTGSTQETQQVPYTASLSPYLTAPTPAEGVDAKFDGWYIDPELTTPFTGTTMPKGLVLYAKWKMNTHAVTFNANQGVWDVSTQMKTAAYPSGAALATGKPADPTRDGYIFTGWYMDVDATMPADMNTPVMSDNMTLYAGWRQSTARVEYTVKFQTADGKEVAESVTGRGRVGSSVTVSAVKPTVAGFENFIPNELSQNRTLTNGENEIVFIYTDPTTALYTVQYVYGSENILTEPDVQAKAATFFVSAKVKALFEMGYQIVGAKTQKVNVKAGNKNVVTFQCEPIVYTITYLGTEGATVSGGNPGSYTIPQLKEKSITLNNPTKEGYDFAGWAVLEPSTTWTGGEGHDPMNTVIENGTRGNLTFVAKWLGQVTITYKADPEAGGTVNGEAQVEENVWPVSGEAQGATAEPNDGYEFEGWYRDGKPVSKDETFKPKKDEFLLLPDQYVDATYVARFKGIKDELSVVKTLTNGKNEDGSDRKFKANETATFDITVTNNGTTVQKNVVVSEMAGAKIVAGTGYKVENGKAVIETMAPGDKVTVKATYTVTQDDIDSDKPLENVATVNGKDTEPAPIPEEEKNPELTSTKTLTNGGSGENGAFKANETATFDITVTNSGNTTQKGVIVSEMEGATIVEGDGYKVENGKAVIETMAPGDKVTVKATYTVTQDDIDSDKPLENVATVNGKDTEPAPIPDETPNPQLTSTKKLTNQNEATGKDGAFKANETAKFDIVVENTGNTVQKNVVVTEKLAGAKIVEGEGYKVNEDGTATITEIQPGKSVTVKAEYTVTQDDIESGESLQNIATVNGTDTVPAPIPDETPNPELTSEKTLTNKGTAEDGKFKVDDVAKFDIVVENTGNTVQTNVIVTETLAGAKIVAGDGYTVNEDGTIATIDEIQPGATVTVKAEYKVTQADIDSPEALTNIATVQSDSNPVPEPNPEPIPTEDKNDELTATKTVTNSGTGTKGAFRVGETATFDITVENSGNTTQTNVTVTEQLKDAMIVVGDGYTINEAGQAVIEKLAPGATVVVKAQYTVTQADIDSDAKLKNVALVKGDNGTEPDPEPETVIPVPEKMPGMQVVKEVADSGAIYGYQAGNTINYIIKVYNTGNTTLKDITVTDRLEGATIVAGEGYTVNPADGTATIAELAPGASQAVTATYTVTEADLIKGDIMNIANATAGDLEAEGHAYVTTVGAKKVLKIEKTVDGKDDGTNVYNLGEVINYTVTATNVGNITLTDITLTDKLTGDTWPIDTLAPGKSETFTTSYTVTEADILAGNVRNTVTGSADETTVVPGTIDTPTQKAEPSLAVTKKADKTADAKAGDVITYTITVTNNGNVTMSNIQVEDGLEGATIIAGEGYTVNPDGKAVIAELAPSASQIVTATYTVTEDDVVAGRIVNTATATGTDPNGYQPEESGGSETVKTEEAKPGIQVNKTIVRSSNVGADLNEVVNFNIRVHNTGNLTLKNVTVTDELAGAAIVAAEDGSYTMAGGNAVIETMAPGATVLVKAQYTVTEADIQSGDGENGKWIVNTATATGTASNDEQVKGSDNASLKPAAIRESASVAKSAMVPDEYLAHFGEVITYTITVTNTGNVTLTDLKVKDSMTGIQLSDKLGTNEGVTYDDANGVFTIDSLAPNEHKTITYTHTVTEEDMKAGSIVNVATTDNGGTSTTTTQTDPAKYTVTVKYMDEQDNELKKEYTEERYVGQGYNVENNIPNSLQDGKYLYDHTDGVTSSDKCEENVVITAYYAPDEDGKDDKPDGTADKYQVFFQYETDGNGSVTPAKDAVNLPEKQTSGTVAARATATASPDYAFDHWTDENGKEVSQDANLNVSVENAQGGTTYTFTAHFAKDANGDNIPDYKQNLVVTVTGQNITEDYNGQNHTAGYTVTVTLDGAKIGDYVNGVNVPDWVGLNITSAPATGRNVAESKAIGLAENKTVTLNPAARSGDTDTFNTKLSVTDGSLTINPRNVTLTSPTVSRIYNGSALRATNIIIGGEGFVNGEGVSFNVSGSQTNVGSSQNTFTYSQNRGTNLNNYKISVYYGTLTVTAAPVVPGPGPVVPGPGPGPVIPGPGPGTVTPGPTTPTIPTIPGPTVPDDNDDNGPVEIDDNIVPLGRIPSTVRSNAAKPYKLSTEINIEEELTPLAANPLMEHSCCILHFVLMLGAMAVAMYYTHDKKKRQKKEFEIRAELQQ